MAQPLTLWDVAEMWDYQKHRQQWTQDHCIRDNHIVTWLRSRSWVSSSWSSQYWSHLIIKSLVFHIYLSCVALSVSPIVKLTISMTSAQLSAPEQDKCWTIFNWNSEVEMMKHIFITSTSRSLVNCVQIRLMFARLIAPDLVILMKDDVFVQFRQF